MSTAAEPPQRKENAQEAQSPREGVHFTYETEQEGERLYSSALGHEQEAQTQAIASTTRDDEDPYYSDDEDFLSALEGDANDLVVDLSREEAIIKQLGGGVLAWSITGYRDEDGHPLPPRELRAHPPRLLLKDSEGGEATFELTREFVKSLGKELGSVEKAYFGIDDTEKGSLSERANAFLGDIMLWGKEHPVMVIFFAVVLFVAFVLPHLH